MMSYYAAGVAFKAKRSQRRFPKWNLISLGRLTKSERFALWAAGVYTSHCCSPPPNFARPWSVCFCIKFCCCGRMLTSCAQCTLQWQEAAHNNSSGELGATELPCTRGRISLPHWNHSHIFWFPSSAAAIVTFSCCGRKKPSEFTSSSAVAVE